MNFELVIKENVIAYLNQEFDINVTTDTVLVQETRKGFTGNFTVVLFPFLKQTRQNPQDLGQQIATYLMQHCAFIEQFEIVQGFLNLSIKADNWVQTIVEISTQKDYGTHPATGKKVVLEYCGPNTNKPLHLGHLRNLMIGHSTAAILEAAGHEVHKVNIYNDRGINICKSMYSWQRLAQGKTPADANRKGDFFVGDYYVAYKDIVDAEMNVLMESGLSKKEALLESKAEKEVKQLLRDWENGNPEVLALWKTMNEWVYQGFEVTYDRLGVTFERHYKESDYYEFGLELVHEGLKSGVFYKKDDGSVRVNMESIGEDEKILIRSEGTSLYLTQDLGVAAKRFDHYQMDESIYVVADEQNYHFKALKYCLQLLEKPYAEGIFHLAYGLVDLPSGRMKTREGTKVDADDLMDDMIAKAQEECIKTGKLDDFEETDKQTLFNIMGIGALKFYLLRVNPKKKMLFNPEESIELQGFTAPFIQYSYTRIQSIQRRFGTPSVDFNKIEPQPLEIELIQNLYNYSRIIEVAAEQYDPSLVANYTYSLAKLFNKFYAELPILTNEDDNINHWRVFISSQVGSILQKGLGLLGIDAPSRM